MWYYFIIFLRNILLRYNKISLMDKIIKFYELNEKDLINYNQDTIDKLYKLITDTKNKLYSSDWLEKCCTIIEECDEVFSIMNSCYIYFIDEYINKLKGCITNNMDTGNFNNLHIYTARKIKLYIQLLEYLKMINYDSKVFFDADKYDIVMNTYKIFFNLKGDINKCYIEWYSNNYILYYSQSLNYTNICIYYLDDLFGYKIFLSFKKNNFTEKIKLCVFDIIIKTEKDFYNRIEKMSNYKLHFINIKQIAKCFSLNCDNVTTEYQESNFIDSSKMLQYVHVFLND